MKTKVNKSDYEIHEYISGYYGICKKDSNGGECIFGGDSAWEDSYDKELVQQIFDSWDGELIDGHIE